MKHILLLVIALVAVNTASAQGFGKKKSVEPASTPVVAAPPAATSAPAAATKAPAGKGWSGTVCTLIGCANGKSAGISKADAKTSVSRNEILCLCVKNSCYIILNGDGTNASAKLAELAGGTVTVTGKLLKKGGVNVILADSIH